MIRFIALAGILLAACSSPEDRACVLEPGPPGTTRLTCPDGTTTLVPTRIDRVPHGRIEGVARYFGRDDNEGIEVRTPPYLTRTAADGSWALEDVTPSNYQLSVSADAYQSVNVKRFLSLPGTAHIRPVTLYIARNVLPDDTEKITVSPRGDAVLAESKSALLLLDVGRFEIFGIAGASLHPRFTADGKYVYFAETDATGLLARWDVDASARQVLDEQVTEWALAGDDRTVVYERNDDAGLKNLRIWYPARNGGNGGDIRTAGNDVTSWRLEAGNLVVALLGSGAQNKLLFTWNVALAQAGAVTTATALPFEVARDGSSFAFQNAVASVGLYDGKTGRVWDLGGAVPVCGPLAPPGCASFSPDGRRILLDGSGGVILRELSSGVSRRIAGSTATPPSFSPGGERVLLVHDTRVEVFSLATGTAQDVFSGAKIEAASARFTPRGDAVVFDAPLPEDPQGPDRTWLWSAKDGLQLAADESSTRIFSPSGDALLVAGKALWLTELDRGTYGEKLAERSRSGLDFARFSPDGSRVAWVEPYGDTGPSGVLRELVRGEPRPSFEESYVAGGFRYTPANDLVYVRRFVRESEWGALSVRHGDRVVKLAERALWSPLFPIEVSEKGTRVLYHVVQPDSEIRLVLMNLDEERPVPVDTVRKPSRVLPDEAAGGSQPRITERFLMYHLSGDRPGWYVSLYPLETPQGGAEVEP